MRKKILVVDDDPTSLKSLEAVLTNHGFEVKASAHAEDIEKKAADFKPDLIVMDLMMPHVDGTQVVKKLQMDSVLKKIPVVFLTALQMKDEKRGLEFEVSVENKSYRTLTKPFNTKALITEIEGLVRQG